MSDAIEWHEPDVEPTDPEPGWRYLDTERMVVRTWTGTGWYEFEALAEVDLTGVLVRLLADRAADGPNTLNVCG